MPGELRICNWFIFYYLQKEIDEVCFIWNAHRIRKMKNQNSPNGRPLLMYDTPEMYDAEDCLCPVSLREIELCEEETDGKGNVQCDKTVYELCKILIAENKYDYPLDHDDAILLYEQLRYIILQSV